MENRLGIANDTNQAMAIARLEGIKIISKAAFQATASEIAKKKAILKIQEERNELIMETQEKMQEKMQEGMQKEEALESVVGDMYIDAIQESLKKEDGAVYTREEIKRKLKQKPEIENQYNEYKKRTVRFLQEENVLENELAQELIQEEIQRMEEAQETGETLFDSFPAFLKGMQQIGSAEIKIFNELIGEVRKGPSNFAKMLRENPNTQESLISMCRTFDRLTGGNVANLLQERILGENFDENSAVRMGEAMGLYMQELENLCRRFNDPSEAIPFPSN